MNKIKICFNEDYIELWGISDYMDNASFAGVGQNHIDTIYKKLRQEGKIKVVNEGQTTVLNKTEDLFIWLRQNGYEYYVNALFIRIFKERENKIRYE